MKKKILVVYYSQTGQLEKIVKSFTKPFFDSDEFELSFYKIELVKDYKFPWSYSSFFDVFPESVLGLPVSELKDVQVNNSDYDLIVIAYQVWFLSPSLPILSFLKSKKGKEIIKGKNIITINGSRNMWIMAQQEIKKILKENNSNLVGNIALVDRSRNFTSLITIVLWLIYGKKHFLPHIFPQSGVSEKDITESGKFAEIIKKAFQIEDLSNLQKELVSAGAVDILPHLLAIEKKGKRIFTIWAKLIKKAGNKNQTLRYLLLKVFFFYLITAIMLISPVVTMLSFLKSKLKPDETNELKNKYSLE